MSIRTRSIFGLSFLHIAALILLSSCAPAIEEKMTSPATFASGPRLFDKNLQGLDKKSFADKYFTSTRLTLPTTTEKQLELIESEFSISQLSGIDEWKEKGTAALKTFLESNSFQAVTAENSIYLDLVNRQISPQVKLGTEKADAQLAEDVETVATTLRTLQPELKIGAETNLEEKLKKTAEFMALLTAKINELPIMPEFKTLFVAQMNTQSVNLIIRAEKLSADLNSSPDLKTIIQKIDDYVVETKTELTPEDIKDLENGRKLGKLVAETTNAKTGLQSIALVWQILDPAQRIEMIKSENEKLYEFFSDKNEGEVRCIVERSCKSLFAKIILKVGVYPAIEEYGVSKLQAMLNEKSKKYVIDKVNLTALTSLSGLTERIISEVKTTVMTKRDELKSFNQNFYPLMTKSWNDYLTALGSPTLKGLMITAEGKLETVSVQSMIIRSQLNLLPDLENRNKLIPQQFQILEQVLNLPHLNQSSQNKSKSTAFVERSQLVDLLLAPVARQYDDPQSTDYVVRVKDQANALMTTSKLIRELADWKATSFDNNLSSILGKDLIKEFQSEDLNRPFFGKPDLLAIVLSVSSQTLKLLQEDSSPLILIDNDQKVVLMKDFTETSAPLALAAATDFINGNRSKVVYANDISALLLGLVEFYSATASLEKTSSTVLREVKPDGATLLGQVIDSRKRIKVLIVALANFISNQLMQQNGLVRSEYVLADSQMPFKTNKSDKMEYELLDQVHAIEALVRTYETSDIDVYLWSALDIYYAMNHRLYDSKTKFYIGKNFKSYEQVDAAELLSIYKSLLRLKPYLAAPSQVQMENVFAGWLANL